MKAMREDLRRLGRTLAFLETAEDYKATSWPVATLTVLAAWLVGLARHAADPRPAMHWGLFSLAYVLGFSVLLWLAAFPLSARRLPFSAFLAFVGSTSVLGVLNVIPVDLWFPERFSSGYFVFVLVSASGYRLTMLWRFLAVGLGLRLTHTLVVMAIPVCAALVAMATTTLPGHLPFGHPTGPENPHDGAGGLVWIAGILAVYASPVVLVAYLAMLFERFAYRLGARVAPSLAHDHLHWRYNFEWIDFEISDIRDIYGAHREDGFALFFHTTHQSVIPLYEASPNFWSFASALESRLQIPPGSIRAADQKRAIDPTLIYSATDSVR
jgi:hypothetical protein